ncbi:unnamed protein product [Arctogadus glacialis]
MRHNHESMNHFLRLSAGSPCCFIQWAERRSGLAVAPLIALIRLSWPEVRSGGGGMARVQVCQLEWTCGMALHLLRGF